MALTPVDLLEELRGALDELEPLIAGRIVDIEMSRLRVLADPVLFRRDLASLIASAVSDAEPTDAITVRVARTGKAAGIDVVIERGGARPDALVGSISCPLVPGASTAGDA
jgi:hypothetical protein